MKMESREARGQAGARKITKKVSDDDGVCEQVEKRGPEPGKAGAKQKETKKLQKGQKKEEKTHTRAFLSLSQEPADTGRDPDRKRPEREKTPMKKRQNHQPPVVYPEIIREGPRR